MIKAVNDPEIKSKLVAQGIDPGGMTPAELTAFQKAEDREVGARDQGRQHQARVRSDEQFRCGQVANTAGGPFAFASRQADSEAWIGRLPKR